MDGPSLAELELERLVSQLVVNLAELRTALKEQVPRQHADSQHQ